MASIDLREISKRYPDGHEAVKGLSIHVDDGELMVFVGPSGCGKTTALRMVAGLEQITSGDLYIGDKRVNDVVPKERDVAMVFQSYALYPHMTVRNNIAFPLRLAGWPPTDIEKSVRRAASILDLEPHLDRKPAQLSGGQRQRVAMGRAIVREPAAFLMDEPLSNLDAKLRVSMRAQLAQLQRSLGTTTIYVTHDQVEAMTLGHRVAVLHQGILEQVDTPLNIYRRPRNAFVATFIGSPAMNLFEGEISEQAIQTPAGPIPLASGLRRRLAAVTDRRVIVGIRPEDFTDVESASPADGSETVNFDVVVEMVEAIGSDLFIFFPNSSKLGELSLELEDAGVAEQPRSSAASTPLAVARVSPFSRIAAGTKATLAVDVNRIHLFDRTTGDALSELAGVA